MISLAFIFALGLKLGKDVLVLPADFVGETAKGAETTAGLQTKDAKSGGDDHALHAIPWLGDALKDLETLHGGGTTSSLVGQHSTDGAEEDAGGGTEMVRSMSRVG